MIHRFFFYSLLVLLPAQLGYHLWPQWSLVLGRRIDYLSPTVYVTDILVLLLLVSYRRIRIPWKIAFLVCVVAFMNIFYSLHWQSSVYAWAKVLEWLMIVLYIVQSKPSIVRISQALSLAILYSSCIAIFQFIFQHSLGFWIFGERTFTSTTPGIAMTNFQLLYRLRAYGTFPHPNVLGGFLAVTLPFITTPPLVFILGCIALVCTFSRSAWIVFILGILFFNVKKVWIRFPVILALIVIGNSFSQFDESVVVREQLMHSAIDIWKSHPLLGVGLGNFVAALPSFLPSKFIYFLQPVHNIYMLILSEIGLIGVIGLSGLMWNYTAGRKYTWPIIALLLLGLVDHYPLTLQQGQLLLALSVGLLFL